MCFVIGVVRIEVREGLATAKERRRGSDGQLLLVGLILVIDSEAQEDALHRGRQDEDAPRAPAVPAQSGKEAAGEEEATWSLDAHHWDAQAADLLEHVGGIDLRNVLDGRKRGCHDAESIGPDGEMLLCHS